MEINNESSAPALPHELAQQIETAKNNLTITEQENIRITGLNRTLETEVGINLKKISDAKVGDEAVSDVLVDTVTLPVIIIDPAGPCCICILFELLLQTFQLLC